MMVNYIVDVGRAVLAILAAWLPTRYWSTLHILPIPRAAMFSAILTIIASAVIGVGGFLEYGRQMGAEVARMMLRVAEGQLKGELPSDAAVNVAPVARAMLSPLEFAVFTPIGLLASYMALSGIARVVSCVAGEPMGDPILTTVDTMARRMIGGSRERRVQRTRLRREGVEVPDRLYEAAWAGVAGADYVVVSSRRKPDWDAGTFVITADKWYKVGTPFERESPEGLRTIYPLKEQTENEVVRRSVRYELPPLRRAPWRS